MPSWCRRLACGLSGPSTGSRRPARGRESGLRGGTALLASGRATPRPWLLPWEAGWRTRLGRCDDAWHNLAGPPWRGCYWRVVSADGPTIFQEPGGGHVPAGTAGPVMPPALTVSSRLPSLCPSALASHGSARLGWHWAGATVGRRGEHGRVVLVGGWAAGQLDVPPISTVLPSWA